MPQKKNLENRFQQVQEKLKNKQLQGAIFLGKPNQQYLLGFTSESPMMLWVPAADMDSNPAIITNPLEENVVKDHNILSDIEIKVILKDFSVRTEKALENRKFWRMTINNQETIVPHFLLEEQLSGHYQTLLKNAKKEEQWGEPFHEVSGPKIMQQALHQKSILQTEWEGQPILHPRESNVNYFIELLNEYHIKKIGVAFDKLTYQNYLKFSQGYKKKTGNAIQFADIGKLMQSQRIIKQDDEIADLLKAAEIGSKGCAAAQKAIHELKTEHEVQAEAEYAMKLGGSKEPAFETIVVSGENSAYPHGHASHKQIEKGDLVTVDIGAIYNGYCSDMTRTVFAGHDAPEETLKIFKIVNQAHKIGLEAVKPGVSWSVPDQKVRDYFKEQGMLQYYNHSLGHGVGIEVHEAPMISSRMTDPQFVLKEGMVLTIEPGLYVPGKGGARTEDTVVVTADGYELITHFEYTHYD